MTAPPGTALGNEAPDEAPPVFVAAVQGREPQQFLTLQSAMAWVEEFENPTGTISFHGQGIGRYTDGDIDLIE